MQQTVYLLHYRLLFDLEKEMQPNHLSWKERTKTGENAKFGCEIM